MGQVFEFGDLKLMHLPIGLVVCGRCWEGGFGVGDEFTELRWCQSERQGSPPRYERVAEDIAAEVRLRVVEISFYNRLIVHLDSGLTAGIRVSGAGLESLARINFADDLRAGKSWSLWGQRHAERPQRVLPMDVAAIPDTLTRNPPASAEAITAASRLLHAPIPEEYAALLAQADGVVADLFVLYECESLPERNATFQFGEYLPEFVTIGDDNGGRAIVVRGGPGPSPVYVVGHGALFPDCMVQVAGSLAEWVAAGCPVDPDAFRGDAAGG